MSCKILQDFFFSKMCTRISNTLSSLYRITECLSFHKVKMTHRNSWHEKYQLNGQHLSVCSVHWGVFSFCCRWQERTLSRTPWSLCCPTFGLVPWPPRSLSTCATTHDWGRCSVKKTAWPSWNTSSTQWWHPCQTGAAPKHDATLRLCPRKKRPPPRRGGGKGRNHRKAPSRGSSAPRPSPTPPPPPRPPQIPPVLLQTRTLTEPWKHRPLLSLYLEIQVLYDGGGEERWPVKIVWSSSKMNQ